MLISSVTAISFVQVWHLYGGAIYKLGTRSSIDSTGSNRLRLVEPPAKDLHSIKLRLSECFPTTGELENYLGRRHEFFYHRAKITGLKEIERVGLIPFFKPPAVDTDLQLLRQATGGACPKLICFASKPKAYSIDLPDKEPRVMLRVRSADLLKNRLALDWTWGGCWTHASQIRGKWPAISPTELFIRVFEDVGSLACLAPVAPQLIWIQINETASIQGAQFRPLNEASALRHVDRPLEQKPLLVKRSAIFDG